MTIKQDEANTERDGFRIKVFFLIFLFFNYFCHTFSILFSTVFLMEPLEADRKLMRIKIGRI